ncbi:MAG TPA: hypothetical protein VFE24_00555, partial [Pirellulales bacterium]|nr:hypothetical protein [Pirellulales bacterium]
MARTLVSGREISEYNRFEDGKQILTVFKDHQPLGSVIFDPKDKRAREAAEFLAKEKKIQGKQFDSIDIASSIAVILFRKQHPCDSQDAMVDALTKKDIEEFENRIAEAKISLKLLRQVPGAGRLAGFV